MNEIWIRLFVVKFWNRLWLNWRTSLCECNVKYALTNEVNLIRCLQTAVCTVVLYESFHVYDVLRMYHMWSSLCRILYHVHSLASDLELCIDLTVWNATKARWRVVGKYSSRTFFSQWFIMKKRNLKSIFLQSYMFFMNQKNPMAFAPPWLIQRLKLCLQNKVHCKINNRSQWTLMPNF